MGHKRQDIAIPVECKASDWMSIPGLPVATDYVHHVPKFIWEHPDMNLTYIPHCHDWYELVIIRAGNAMHHVGNRTFKVSAGDIFAIHPGVVHYFSGQDNNFDANDLYFILESLPLPMEQLKRISGFNMLMFIEPTLEYPDEFKSRLILDGPQLLKLNKLVDEISNELATQPNGYEASVIYKLTEILVFLGRNYNRVAENEMGGTLQRLNEVIVQMERRYAEPLTLAELAAVASSSPRNLQRLFLKAMKTRPMDYLNHIRLQHAAEMLKSGDRQVIDVALTCGFNDAGYFCRRFRREFGKSPIAYRRDNAIY